MRELRLCSQQGDTSTSPSGALPQSQIVTAKYTLNSKPFGLECQVYANEIQRAHRLPEEAFRQQAEQGWAALKHSASLIQVSCCSKTANLVFADYVEGRGDLVTRLVITPIAHAHYQPTCKSPAPPSKGGHTARPEQYSISNEALAMCILRPQKTGVILAC